LNTQTTRMKKQYTIFKNFTAGALCTICFLLNIQPSKAQLLWGFNSYGGSGGYGNIYNIKPDSTTISHYDLRGISGGGAQYSHLVQGTNGLLYGLTYGYGTYGDGVIFSCDTNLNNYTVLHNFNTASGKNPCASLLLAKDGKFYGTANGGGKNALGVLFSFDPVTLTYTDEYDFAKTTGNTPRGSLIQLANGKLFGMANTGGSASVGAIFSFDPVTKVYTDLYNFNTTTSGDGPNGDLVQAANGKLYGTTGGGGTNSLGTLFSFDTGTHAYTVLYNFTSTTDGGGCYTLMKAASGKLYGEGRYGIFTFTPATNTYNYIFVFNQSPSEGGSGALIQLADGKLYGISNGFGTYTNGMVYSFDTGTYAYTVIANVGIHDGSQAGGSLLYTPNNRLYAITGAGGAGKAGTILEYDMSGNKLKQINFNTFNITTTPFGTPLLASNGLIYGMASADNQYNDGIIFSFNPVTKVFADAHDFNDTLGKDPSGSLMQASNGLLYGMTAEGGANSTGVIFSFDPNTGAYADVYDFNSATGAGPTIEALCQASNGLLYGDCENGGKNGKGCLFSFNTATKVYTDIYDFNSSEGNPMGTIIQATNGKLYGTASAATSLINGWDGYIYSYNINTATFTDAYDFGNGGGLMGEYPNAGLCQSSTGKLYVPVCYGGTIGWANGEDADGTLISLDSLGKNTTVLHDFNDTNGGEPTWNVIQANDGRLYGTVQGGLTYGAGMIYQYDTVLHNYTVMHYFNVADGSAPYNGSLLQTKPLDSMMTISVNITPTCSSGQVLTAVVNRLVPTSYTYLWSTGATTSAISNINAAGTYSVTVKDAGGDSVKGAVALQAYTSPTSSQTVAICQGQTFAVGAHSYNMAGTYIDTLKAAGGCDSVITTTLTVNAWPTIKITGKDTICIGATTKLTASGGTYYAWSTGFNGSFVNVNPTITTTYSLAVLSAAGCAKDTIFRVKVDSLPNVKVSGKDTICIGSSTTLTASGANTYTWGPSSGLSATTGAVIIATPTTSASHWIDGTAGVGCVTQIYVYLTVEPTLTITASVNPATIIMGDTTTLTASGAPTYIWKPTTALSAGKGSPVKADPSATTTYTLIATNGGCTDSTTVVVTVNITTGVNNLATNSGAALYPNPATDAITITSSIPGRQTLVDIYNINGEKVETAVFTKEAQTWTMNVNGLAAGIYFAKVTVDNTLNVIKFIKQ